MAYTGTDVATEARAVHLNDSIASLYTNATLLPIIAKCYEDAQRRCTIEGIKVTNEVSAVISYTANAATITAPADLLIPKEILARMPNSSLNFTPLDQDIWEPEDVAQSVLTKWAWREETIFVLPATQNMDVKIRYSKTLPVLAAIGNTILITDLKGYLAAKVGATAALTIGENPDKAGIINEHAEALWQDFLGIHTKQRQGTPVRRRPFRRPRRRILG